MAEQTLPAAVTSRGWMSFTVPNGQVLHLGGPNATAPTSALSGGKNETDPTCFLVAGIPQRADKLAFADVMRSQDGANGHAIKHATITLVSAGATVPAGRYMTDGSTPDTARGAQLLAGDGRTITNGRSEIFGFKFFNRSGGNAIVEVEVFE